ncbi:LIM/homeobox protein Lhx3 [Culicoides brevitarsis]|uniref:LIM/homeobox protein Lhx3 n=1 Tax=Culicoides brevitarsis TaxID=469753 RepID=UPI00307C22C9
MHNVPPYVNHNSSGHHNNNNNHINHNNNNNNFTVDDVKRLVAGMHSTENVNTDSVTDIHQRNATNAGGMGHTTVSNNPVTNNGTVSSISSAPNTNAGGAKECAGCGKRITERFLLKALDLFWHEDCLKCGCCDCRLGEVGSTLYTKANLLLCKRDYLRLFGATGYCAACNKIIPAFEMVMRAKNNVYHLECFACQQCNHRFCVGDRFYLCDNKILCEYDYEERLVFANIAYNPSSLAHIRRQVSSLQPPNGENVMNRQQQQQQQQQQQLASSQGGPQAPPSQQNQQQTMLNNRQNGPTPVNGLPNAPGNIPPSSYIGEKLPMPQPPSNLGPQRDDGSSGYGSPDSETLEIPTAQ